MTKAEIKARRLEANANRRAAYWAERLAADAVMHADARFEVVVINGKGDTMLVKK